MNIPLIIVCLYVVVLFGISFYVSAKKNKNEDSFLLYRGQNSTWVVAASIAGLAIGGASTIGIAENAFNVGLSAGWYDATWAIGAVVTSFLAMKYLRRSGHSTVSALVRDLYGKNTSFIMVISMCIIQAGIIALQYKAGGSILAALLPEVFTVDSGTFFSFLIFVAIAVLGGMGSVSLTNVLNLILIYVGVITALVIVLTQQGGWAAIQTLVVAEPDVPYLSLTEGMGWIGIFAWVIVMLGNTNSVQGVVQIGLTGKDDKSAQRGYIIGALLMVPVGFICAMLGVASKALLPDATASVALPMILMSIPPVLGGITLSGLWAADMGTACSMIVGLATTVNNDIVTKVSTKERTPKQANITSKIIIIISSTITYLVATQMAAILSGMMMALSMAIGTSFVVIGGLLCPKFTGKKAGFTTILASLIGIVVWNTVPVIKPYFASQVGFFMLAVCVITFVVTSVLDKEKLA
ncbi:sodium:solute symporter family protein [Bengtsoniella intestinalis]|uniref:sodium:solute symporter family protein n=1 Tax=Bengtsoniella intestinalis TaxID=3073143 RepID=UPI00391F7222